MLRDRTYVITTARQRGAHNLNGCAVELLTLALGNLKTHGLRARNTVSSEETKR